MNSFHKAVHQEILSIRDVDFFGTLLTSLFNFLKYVEEHVEDIVSVFVLIFLLIFVFSGIALLVLFFVLYNKFGILKAIFICFVTVLSIVISICAFTFISFHLLNGTVSFFTMLKDLFPKPQPVHYERCAFRWTWLISSYGRIHDGCF